VVLVETPVGADGGGAACCDGGEALACVVTGEGRGNAVTDGCWGRGATGSSWDCDWYAGAGGGDGGGTTGGDWAGEDQRVFTPATSTGRCSVLGGGLAAAPAAPGPVAERARPRPRTARRFRIERRQGGPLPAEGSLERAPRLAGASCARRRRPDGWQAPSLPGSRPLRRRARPDRR
jgi:hypothetical protein